MKKQVVCLANEFNVFARDLKKIKYMPDSNGKWKDLETAIPKRFEKLENHAKQKFTEITIELNIQADDALTIVKKVMGNEYKIRRHSYSSMYLEEYRARIELAKVLVRIEELEKAQEYFYNNFEELKKGEVETIKNKILSIAEPNNLEKRAKKKIIETFNYDSY